MSLEDCTYEDAYGDRYFGSRCTDCGSSEISCGTPNGPLCGDCFRERKKEREARRERLAK